VKTLDPVTHRIRREFILQQARHLFAHHGFTETSMDDIARICRVQKASLYHYFESKQQILQEMADLECAHWAAHLAAYEGGTDLRQTLSIIAETFLKDMDQPAHQEFFKIIHFESHKNPAIQHALEQSPTQNKAGFYAVFVRHLEGRLPRRRVAILVTQFMGALIHYASLTRLRKRSRFYEPFSDAEFVEQLVNVFAQAPAILNDPPVKQ